MGLFGNKNKLPKSQINEATALQILMNGAPFVVTLPITQVVQTSNGKGLSVRVGFYRHTFYKPPQAQLQFRKVRTNVIYDPKGITIQHAMQNGQHVILNPGAIARVTKYKDGVSAELHDGTKYIFVIDKRIEHSFWEQLGFKRDMPINAFYNVLLGRLPKHLQDELDFEAKIEKQKELEMQNQIEMQNTPEPPPSENVEEVSPLEKIKEAKELLDIGAITQEEFEEIKDKYLKMA